MKTERTARLRLPPGLAARKVAVELVDGVLNRAQPFDDLLARELAAGDLGRLPPRDQAFVRLLAATVLRRYGQLGDILDRLLDRPLPPKRGLIREILLIAIAQLVFLDTPAHAAIDLAVRQAKSMRPTRHFDGLTNALLRLAARDGKDMIKEQDVERLNTPDWLWTRWSAAYGEETARAIACANVGEAALDLTVPVDTDLWAERLGGQRLAATTVRLASRGRVDRLAGYAEGAWWVQDVAATLPARLFGDVAGKRIADLCAAPGGKTAQLVSAGARVVSVDQSRRRLERLEANLKRLGLTGEVVAADARTWRPATADFDGVLLDAPCLATGTMRRHPDIAHLKSPGDLDELRILQAELLDNAVRLLRPGGTLVYCTCSLEPEEGPDQIAALLKRVGDFEAIPIDPAAEGWPAEWIDSSGYLRTLPFHAADSDGEATGIDGFFAARLRRR